MSHSVGWIPRLAVLRDDFVRRRRQALTGGAAGPAGWRLCPVMAVAAANDHRARWENPHRESTADSRGHHGLPPVTCSCRAVVGTFPARTLTTADSGPMLALSSIARLTSVKESDEGDGVPSRSSNWTSRRRGASSRRRRPIPLQLPPCRRRHRSTSLESRRPRRRAPVVAARRCSRWDPSGPATVRQRPDRSGGSVAGRPCPRED